MTVSETFGEGKTENVASIRSGYSSLIFANSSDPRPDPVPPPIANHQHDTSNLEREKAYSVKVGNPGANRYSLPDSG